jgi:hypothetical protein
MALERGRPRPPACGHDVRAPIFSFFIGVRLLMVTPALIYRQTGIDRIKKIDKIVIYVLSLDSVLSFG